MKQLELLATLSRNPYLFLLIYCNEAVRGDMGLEALKRRS